MGLIYITSFDSEVWASLEQALSSLCYYNNRLDYRKSSIFSSTRIS